MEVSLKTEESVNRSLLERVAIVAIVVGVVSVAASVFRPATTQSMAGGTSTVLGMPPIPLAGLPVMGRGDAKVVMVEFSDFECPYCGQFSRHILPAFRARYIQQGEVQLAFAHLPLPNHPHAAKAAATAECAGRQGRFWPMHDRLFSDPKQLDSAGLDWHASELGLEKSSLETCRNGDGVRTVRRDVELARRLGVSATPTFFVGRRNTAANTVDVKQVVVGARPLADFESAVSMSLN